MGFAQPPTRFYLVSQTLFELEYRSTLPNVLREIYYPNNPNPYTMQLPYLSFLQQISWGRLLPYPDAQATIDVRTRMCHSAVNALITQDCAGVTGADNCTNIVGHLLVNHRPGDRCHSGGGNGCRWYDPPSRFGDSYHRSWTTGTLTLTFNWSDTPATSRIQTPRSSAIVEGNQIKLIPDNSNNLWLGAGSETYQGLILMRKRTFLDGMKSLDPLGFPEIGENELVFEESNNRVSLRTACSAWFLATPPESFLLRIPIPGGGESVLSDLVEWYAWRIRWLSRIPFYYQNDSILGYGYDHLSSYNQEDPDNYRPRGNIFISQRATYSAGTLPDYNPNLTTNWLGSQQMEMRFRPNPNSTQGETVIGRARFEVFFPATGTRHPGTLSDPYTGQRAPNWFYYYWRVVGSPNDVHFTTHSPYPDNDTIGGWYDSANRQIYIRNKEGNYVEGTLHLFRIGTARCNNQPRVLIVSADTLQVRGIHAFLRTLYHERGHQWTYLNHFRSRSGAFFPIVTQSGGFRDQDGDSLDDEWEAMNGLCPHSKDTTGLFDDPPYDELGGDPEVVVEIYAYRHLLQNQSLWRHDWSDKGLQKGNPLERFPSFPWTYTSTRRNNSAYNDLLTDMPCPFGNCP